MTAGFTVASVLTTKFAAPCAERLLENYEKMVLAARVSDADHVLTSAGRFSEAALRCLHQATTGEILDRVDVGNEIDRLERLPKDSQEESIRLLVPRAIRVVYQIACNRGARHDRVGFDPNHMDARLAVASASWVLAELVRLSFPGSLDPTDAQRLVSEIVEPRTPVLENLDGLTFFHKKDASARDVVLVRLRVAGGTRLPREELFQAGKLHGHSVPNVRATLSQLRRSRLVHENDEGVRLLAPGLSAADRVLRIGTP